MKKTKVIIADDSREYCSKFKSFAALAKDIDVTAVSDGESALDLIQPAGCGHFGCGRHYPRTSLPRYIGASADHGRFSETEGYCYSDLLFK